MHVDEDIEEEVGALLDVIHVSGVQRGSVLRLNCSDICLKKNNSTALVQLFFMYALFRAQGQ